GTGRIGSADPPRRPAHRPAPEGPRRLEALHALGRAHLPRLRRLPGGGDRHRRRPPRAVGGLRGRGLGEGHADARRRRAHRRPRRHERHERARLRAAQPVPDARPGGPGARHALGAGVAAGDGPHPVRLAAHEVRHHPGHHRGDPRARRRGARPRHDPALGARLPGLPDGPRLLRGRGARQRRPAPGRGGRARARRRRRGAPAARRRAARRHGRDEPLLGPRRDRPARAGRGARDPRLPQRPGPRLRARRPRALLLPRPLGRPEGRRRRPRRRRADGLPPGLRRGVRGGDPAHHDRPGGGHPPAPASRRRRPRRLHRRDPRRAAHPGAREREHGGVGRAPARRGDGEARRRARAARGPARPAAPHAPVQGARRGPRPRRDRHRRRGRLRLLRRTRRGLLRPGLLAGSGPVRLPGVRAGLRPGGEARPSRPPGRPPPGRRGLRLLRDGVRHPGPPRRRRGRRHGQQRHLGAGEAPDGVPLRLLRRRGAAPGDPLRHGGGGARRPRGARPVARGAAARPPARARRRPARARQRPHGPRGRLPPPLEPRL
ncbi:MAG: Thiamine pyrophosphate-requiring enzymes, partial [uncultured Solirubrobacteraceae bacterium]